MDNSRLVAIVEAIRQLALLPYPFPETAGGVDPLLVLRLGEIAGLAGRALAEHKRHVEPGTTPA